MNLEAIGPVIAASLFGLVSGFNDDGNLMGSFTSGRVISPRAAAFILLVSLAGPFVWARLSPKPSAPT